MCAVKITSNKMQRQPQIPQMNTDEDSVSTSVREYLGVRWRFDNCLSPQEPTHGGCNFRGSMGKSEPPHVGSYDFNAGGQSFMTYTTLTYNGREKVLADPLSPRLRRTSKPEAMIE